MKKTLISAAIVLGILAALALVGCAGYAMNWFGLQDLLMGETSAIEGEHGIPPREITLAGVAGSPEHQAAKEWNDFIAGYDTDGALLRAVGNGDTGLEARYTIYGCYTREMADKLDEIAAKHRLRLHETDAVLLEPDAALVADLLSDPAWYWAGYVYEDKTFQFDGTARLSNGREFIFQCRGETKGSFGVVSLNIGDIELYEVWNTPLPDGTNALLALCPDKALVFADLEHVFMAVNVLSGTDEGLTRADLEVFADGFRFSALDQKHNQNNSLE